METSRRRMRSSSQLNLDRRPVRDTVGVGVVGAVVAVVAVVAAVAVEGVR